MKNFFGHQQSLYIKPIIDKTYSIMEQIPNDLIPTFKHIMIPIHDDNSEQYPIFNRYPTETVAVMQQRKEKKIESMQNQEKHQELLKALQAESKQIAAKQAEFAQQQKS